MHQELLHQGRTLTITCGALIGLLISSRLSELTRGIEHCDLEIRVTSDFLDLEKGEADLAWIAYIVAEK